jgi:hypothetical protein
MKIKFLFHLLASALTSASFAQISGTVNNNVFYGERVYLSGNLSVSGNAVFENGIEVAAGVAAPSLAITGNTVMKSLAGTASAPLRGVTITGDLDLSGPVVVSDIFRVAGSVVARRGITKIQAGSITITGNLTLADEQILILETRGGDLTIGGNLIAPINANATATLVVNTTNGGSLRFSGTREPRVTLSTSSGSSIGRPLYPVNMSLRASIGGSGLTIGFVISSPEGGAGSVTSRFLIRAVGPGLARFGIGIASVAEAPRLTVHRGGSAQFSDWSANIDNRNAVLDANSKAGAFPIDIGSRDAAVVLDLPPGEITVSVDTVPGTRAGEVIVEVYRVP